MLVQPCPPSGGGGLTFTDLRSAPITIVTQLIDHGDDYGGTFDVSAFAPSDTQMAVLQATLDADSVDTLTTFNLQIKQGSTVPQTQFQVSAHVANQFSVSGYSPGLFLQPLWQLLTTEPTGDWDFQVRFLGGGDPPGNFNFLINLVAYWTG